ncbi:MAG TPA: phosphotransferase [Polyangiaceae bacterium]
MGELVQSLWDGYGEIVRERHGERTQIVKTVRPPRDAHPRKVRSYQVEATFYEKYAARCDEACRVARLIDKRPNAIVLEDLDVLFPRRDGELEPCLAWLAAFHTRFLGVKPEGLWPIGTYWQLDTRREELAAMRDPALRARAPALDRALREARWQTFVHGDAKPANFCWSRDGARVAAVDFQYVGGGPGIRDVAYLLHGEDERLLDFYFAHLANREVEREWRALYPIARDDFRRFLDGWRR